MVSASLTFQYTTFVGANRKKRITDSLEDDSMQEKEITAKDGTTRLLALDDIMLYHKVPMGEEDVSCNSTFM